MASSGGSISSYIGGKAAAVIAVVALGTGAVIVPAVTGGGGGACEAPTCFPDATNTGVTDEGALVTVNTNVTLSTNGATYQDKLVNGCISVTGNNVTIRNVRINCHGSNGIEVGGDFGGATGLVVEDSEFDCNGNEDEANGRTSITNSNYTVTRVEVYGGCENALWCDHDCTIQDSYVYDIIPCDIVVACDAETAPHTDGIQIPSGASNIVVDHNRVIGGYTDATKFGNSAITVANNNPVGLTNVSVTDNLVAGGGYTIYCPTLGSAITLTGNRWSTVYTSTVGGFAPQADCEDETLSDNLYYDGANVGDSVF